MFAIRLKSLRKNKKLTQAQMANMLGITRQGYAKYENNDSEPDLSTIDKLANFFGVSTDYLLGRDESENNLPELTTKDERDIAKDLEKIIDGLEGHKNGYAQFDGQTIEDMDDEDRELLIASLEQSMRLAKRMAKKKFTPKKFRDKE